MRFQTKLQKLCLAEEEQSERRLQAVIHKEKTTY